MTIITSRSNPIVKQIRKLRELKERQQSGLFYIEGLRLVGEAVQQSGKIETLIVAPDLLISDFGKQLVNEQKKKGSDVVEVSAEVFSSFSLKDGPQGIAALGRQVWKNLGDINPQAGDVWIALDSVADPGNLGTILRTCDAVGGRGLILLDHSTDPYDPSAVRGSMGAVFSQQLVQTAFNKFAEWKKETGCPLIGTSGSSALDYQAFKYPSRMVLLMGSERQGLQEHHFEICDQVVRIPMVGRSDSLNLAVATAVAVYEVFNQQRKR